MSPLHTQSEGRDGRAAQLDRAEPTVSECVQSGAAWLWQPAEPRGKVAVPMQERPGQQAAAEIRAERRTLHCPSCDDDGCDGVNFIGDDEQEEKD